MRKLGLIILCLIPQLLPAQPAFVRDSLDQYMKRIMEDWKIPGMAVCIVKDGKVQHMKGYGVRELGKPGKIDENTLFMIASNTKAFTGISMAWLDTEKRLSLDDKVQKWMPWFSLKDELASRDMTIRDALCHRLGFRTFQGDFLNWATDASRRTLMERMKYYEPQYPFRYRYGYCNMGFLTAGEIIPLATDTSWDDFIKYRFFQPMDMKRSSTQSEVIMKDLNAARPYTLVKGELTALPYPNINALGPAASINSCISDLSHWMMTLLDSGRYNGRPVIPYRALQMSWTSQMNVNQLSPEFPSKHFSSYGLGWYLSDYQGRKVIHHDGGADGFVTTLCIVPEERLGIVILTNTDANWIYEGLRWQLLDAYLGAPYKNYHLSYFPRFRESQNEEKKELLIMDDKVSRKERNAVAVDAYVGKYLNPIYGAMEIKKEGNDLIMYFSQHKMLSGKLDFMGSNTFRCTYSIPTYGIKEIPFTMNNDKVKSCTVSVNGFVDYMTYEFMKVL